MRKVIFIISFFFVFLDTHSQNKELKIASYNVRYDNVGDSSAGNAWDNRSKVIAGMILFHDLDIVGTQECLHHQITDLEENLQDYSYIGRGREKNSTEGEYSAILYKDNRFKLLENGDFWLSETPNVPSIGWDAALNRICTWGNFEEIESGLQFYFFNLHFDHIGKMARSESAKLVLSKIKEIAGDKPVVLTGDFNVDQFDPAYQLIHDSELLDDCFEISPIVYASNGTFNAFDIQNTSKERIDHVFVTKHFSPTRYGILTDIYWHETKPEETGNENRFLKQTPRLPSDHFPIVVQLKY